jgi:hypothetical protein
VDLRPPVSRAGSGAAARIATVIATAAVLLVLGAAPASAHTASGPRPTNYLTTLGSVSPAIPGVTVHVVDLGNKLQLTNRTDHDIIVLGYDGEPYLKVGPSGFYENLRSPATYLNRTRTGSTPVPPIAMGTGASTPPRWHRVSGSHTAIWHDHRIHWMGTSPPPNVREAPGAFHTIDPQWTVVFRNTEQTVAVRGQLDWVPGPPWWQWLPIAGGLFVIGLFAARRQGSAAIAALVVLVGVDVAHTVSAEVARAGAQLTKIIQFFGDNFVSVFVWIVAAVTIWGLRRRRVEALYGLLLVGAMVGLVSGVVDLSYLWKSELPTVGPYLFARIEVVTAFGLGLGIAVGALLALVRATPRIRTRETHDPRWVERLVAGLDDDQVALESGHLDAAEVVPMALTDLADRLAPIATDLGSDALVFVVLAQDEIGSHVWSITAAAVGTIGVRLQHGRPAPARAELHITFPAFLSLMGGTLTVARAVAGGRLDINGDAGFVAALEPYLAAPATVPVAT